MHHQAPQVNDKRTKVQATQNYRLAEGLRAHTRDFLFLSATPHQGDPYQFWSLVQLLDDSLFESADALLEHRGLLGRVMIRRTKREVTDAARHPPATRWLGSWPRSVAAWVGCCRSA